MHRCAWRRVSTCTHPRSVATFVLASVPISVIGSEESVTAGPEALRSLLAAGEVRAAGAKCAVDDMCLFYLLKFQPLQLEPLQSDTLSFSPKWGHDCFSTKRPCQPEQSQPITFRFGCRGL